MPVVPVPVTCHSEKMEVQHVARNTDLHLRNQMIYSVFVRNYSSEGTFEKVREDLPRIRSLGADIIWLMPIHPIGKSNRKLYGITGLSIPNMAHWRIFRHWWTAYMPWA